jgi:hypothetical protein
MRWSSFHCTSFGHRENKEASLFFFFCVLPTLLLFIREVVVEIKGK